MVSRSVVPLMIACLLCVLPFAASAKDEQADMQCPPGGTVGQKCKDNTNGYTTSGHCTHIMVCAADSWPGSPRGCSQGQTVGQDCPYPPKISSGTTTPPVGSPATQNPNPNSPQSSASDIFNQVFSQNMSNSPQVGASIVGSTSIQGIEYLITQTNESLPVGSPLAPEPPPIILNLGPDVANLQPDGVYDPSASVDTNMNATGRYGYPANNSSFSQPSEKNGNSNSETLLQQVVSLGENLAGNVIDTITNEISGNNTGNNTDGAVGKGVTRGAVFAVPDTLFGEPGGIPQPPSFWHILRADAEHVAMWVANSIDDAVSASVNSSNNLWRSLQGSRGNI